jgi:hypothetical protein
MDSKETYEEKRRRKEWDRKFHASSGNSERGRLLNLQLKHLKNIVIYEVCAKTEEGEPVL